MKCVAWHLMCFQIYCYWLLKIVIGWSYTKDYLHTPIKNHLFLRPLEFKSKYAIFPITKVGYQPGPAFEAGEYMFDPCQGQSIFSSFFLFLRLSKQSG